jgi:caffeoyl-CoA O-methyltransferase
MFNKHISQYIENHLQPEPELLAELNRETHLKVLQPRMLSGHYQGRLLAMVSQMIQPKYILEIGTFTGYSALCLAEGLQKNGKLITLELNDELERIAQKYFNESEYNNCIEPQIGDALELIPQLNYEFDLSFIDGDKEQYNDYYELVLSKTANKGFILVDNVLWDGKVLQTPDEKDFATKALIDFNRKITSDTRVNKIMLPVRDGLFLLQKIM